MIWPFRSRKSPAAAAVTLPEAPMTAAIRTADLDMQREIYELRASLSVANAAHDWTRLRLQQESKELAREREAHLATKAEHPVSQRERIAVQLLAGYLANPTVLTEASHVLTVSYSLRAAEEMIQQLKNNPFGRTP